MIEENTYRVFRLNVGLERTHMPKGGMCTTCEKLNTNCSKFEFENMPVIRTTGNGTRIVKCTEYMRSNVKLTG